MDTDKLNYFVTIAETGSLTKASQVLGISHSGLSKAISALENETKLTLFRPQGRGLEITQEGQWLYTKAQEILRISGEIIRGKKTEQSSVSIGLSEVIAFGCASLICEVLGLPTKIVHADVGEIETKLLGQEIDFGFGFVPLPKPGIEYLEIGEISLNAYVRADLAEKMKYDQIPFTVPAAETPLNPMGYQNRDGWPSEVSRHIRFSVGSFAMALELLRSGQSAVYMPDYFANKENASVASGPKIIKIKKYSQAETVRKIFLMKRQDAEESSSMKKVSKIVRKECCVK